MNTPLSLLVSLPLLLPIVPLYGDAAPTAPAPWTASATAITLPFSGIERTDLAFAEQASMHELLDLRGGDVSNDNLWTILLVLGIIVLVLILI
jgi:hypothetical protein